MADAPISCFLGETLPNIWLPLFVKKAFIPVQFSLAPPQRKEHYESDQLEADVIFELQRAHIPGAGADTAEIAAAVVAAPRIHWRGKTVVDSAEVIKAAIDARSNLDDINRLLRGSGVVEHLLTIP